MAADAQGDRDDDRPPSPADAATAPTRGGAGAWRLALFSVGAVLATFLILAGVLVLLGQGSTTKVQSSLVGTRAPVFTLAGINGPSVRAPWLSHHPAVLLFFAKWCPPCRAELPRLAPAVGAGSFGPVRVVGIDTGDRVAGVATSFVSASHVRFPVGDDPSQTIASALVPTGLPATVSVSSDGTVTAVHYGAVSPAQFRAVVAALR